MDSTDTTTSDMLKAEDYRLITKASEEFDSGNYDGCIDVLQQLENLKGKDGKYGKSSNHNQAVARFYRGKCRDSLGLQKTLHELNFNEQVPCPSPVPIYNKAVIYYHRHMYHRAMETLMPAIEKMETYDESAAVLVGILVLRLLLVTNQPRKALCFLELLLGQLGVNIAIITADDFNSQEFVPRLEEKLSKNLKLLSLLTHVVNRKVVQVPEDGSAEFTALKAHQYYIMKDFQMAAKQLKKIDVDSCVGGVYNHELNTLIANNMGVIHLRVRHYAIAANFFQNAINFDKNIASNLRKAELHHMSSAKSCEILYNLGIAMLHLRRPKEAFQCFLVPLKTYHSNPRIWFRIAEACIMEYEMKRSKDDKNRAKEDSRSLFSNRIDYSESSQSAAVPEPTMPFAALSLRNALALTRFYMPQLYAPASLDETQNSECQGSNWHQMKDNNFCNPSAPVTKDSFNNMLSSIYAAYSYVCLRLGDYVTALEMSEELLKMENLSDAHKMLGHMYAGEAFIMMDKLSEARPHLEPTFVSNLNTFDFETKDWQVKSLDAAQNVIRYNLAVALTLQGLQDKLKGLQDLEMARSLLNTCTHPIVARKVMSLKQLLLASAAGTPLPRVV